MELYELKIESEQRRSRSMQECGMFFAFSDKQFEENKAPLEEGDKYVRLFGGAFMPKSKVDTWMKRVEENLQWFSSEIKYNNLRRAHIAYELSNHEAYYTGSIDSTMDALGEEYTREEVYKVFREEAQNQEA